MIHPISRISALICLLSLAAPSLRSQNVTFPDSGIVFTVAGKPWPEGLGSQRGVFDVPTASGAVRFQLPWRRHDSQPENHRLLLMNEASGDTVGNVLRLSVTNEECEFLAGPVTKPGRYVLYYLSYEVQPGWGGYSKDYLPPELPPDPRWLASEHLSASTSPASFPRAVTRSIEARTTFDSFFPMEVIPTAGEKDRFLSANPAQYYVFPEERRNPIRMLDEIPVHWTRREHVPYFEGTAGRNEYFTFQIGVYASGIDLRNVIVTFGDLLEKNGHRIPAGQFTCFNTGGIDAFGKSFLTTLHVRKGSVQPLWIGLDIPAGTVPGSYAGPVVVRCDGAKEEVLLIRLMVRDTVFADRGDGEPWRHSRLRWLNSTLSMDSSAVTPFSPIRIKDTHSFSLTGKDLRLGPDGLPEQITSLTGAPILSHPARFIIETRTGTMAGSTAMFTGQTTTDGVIVQHAVLRSSDLDVGITSTIEADGYLHYVYTLKALETVTLKDVRLELPFHTACATTMMGMGRMGSAVPERHYGIWEGSHDSFWIGSQDGGLSCELRGASYTGPLLDLFKPEYPQSWWNDRKGGFSIRKDSTEALATAFSGKRRLAAGDSITFEFALLITPVKRLDMARHFKDRYYHGGGLLPSREEIAAGVRVVNLHHANPANPYINYPFLATPVLRRYVDSAHAAGLKLKLYYTVRELTNHLPELWALRSLGTEIFADGPGGGFPWLREHGVTRYTPQWYQHFDEGDLGIDASMLTAPGPSRWYNFYIEGLRWLIVNTGIDGLYLDDVAFDRQTVKRIRKTLEAVKPGCLIDLHSNTFFSKGPATQYTEFFPYIDKLWFGEGFQYDRMPPENWFVEVSGIPFGLTGDMLEGGGNPWRGMLYGMTVRYPWVTDDVSCDPRALWKVWDAFGITDAVMKGYWQNDARVATDHADVLATTFQRKGKAMIALASWAHDAERVHLRIDWTALGLEARSCILRAPAIANFQPAREFTPGDPIPVEPGKGWILILEPRTH